MSSDNKWTTSVHELVQIFRDGLIALIPVAAKANILWKEPNNYDDWDLIAGSLFESIITRSLEHASNWNAFDSVPKFNQRIDDYSKKSFLTASSCPNTIALICFESNVSPFDTCLFAQLHHSGKVLGVERQDYGSVRFLLAGRSGEAITTLDTLTILL